MAGIILTAVLLGIYILFLLWYIGFRRPLSKEETERYISILENRLGNPNKPPGSTTETLRKFALEDDGKQFFMVNLSKYYEQPQYKDGIDRGITSRDANKRYARKVMPLLFMRACHPYGLFQPMLNLSNISKDDLLWDEINVVRYRSRRDFLDMVTSPQWFAGYGDKQAALRENPNLPSKAFVAFPIIPVVVFTILLLVWSITMACIYFKPL
jgi:hypothetical protein